MTDDEPNDNRPRKLIYETREQVQHIRNQYHQERVVGGVTEQTHKQLAAVAVQYHDVLWEHHDENIVKEKWRDTNIDEIRDLINETVEVPQSVAGDTHNTTTATKPAILAIPHAKLYKITKDLDSICKELGFAAHVGMQTADADDAVV